MKTFENRFGVLVELRNVGANVVGVRVSPSMRLNRFDAGFLAERLLRQLLPDDVVLHCLYDGSFILVSREAVPFLSNACVASCNRDLKPIVGTFECEDGELHTVEVSLFQSDACRCDYLVLDTRFLVLRGTISTSVPDGDEASEV